MQNACMHAAIFLKFMEKSYIQHTCILNVFAAAAKVCSRCQINTENVKCLARLLPQLLLLLLLQHGGYSEVRK